MSMVILPKSPRWEGKAFGGLLSLMREKGRVVLTAGVPRFVLPLVFGHGQAGGARRPRLRGAPYI